jgi:cold shock protein
MPDLAIPGEQVEPTFNRLFTSEATMATMNGTIKRLTDKGFGFIAANDGSEYFFHQSACTGTPFENLREGQSVTFERGQGPKGPRAENVRVAQ